MYGIQKYRFTEAVFETLQDAGLTTDLVDSLRKCFSNTQFDTKDTLLDAIKTCINPKRLSEREENIILKYATISPEEAAKTGYDYNEVKEESARILWKPPMLDPQIQASVLLEAGSMHYIDQGGLEIIINEDFIDRVVQGIQQGIARIEEKNCPTPTPDLTVTPTPN